MKHNKRFFIKIKKLKFNKVTYAQTLALINFSKLERINKMIHDDYKKSKTLKKELNLIKLVLIQSIRILITGMIRINRT